MPTTRISNETSITIDAPRDDVWDALTTPKIIKKWFYGTDTFTDWSVGSDIIHKGKWQGRKYEDKGKIVKVEPGRLLVHTHWSPFSELPDQPENYEEITWSLSELGGKTTVKVAEDNLPSVEKKETSEKNWKSILENLKRTVEAG